jgi:hypothetical protein
MAILIGYYAFRVLIFEAAVFDPIQSFGPEVSYLGRREASAKRLSATLAGIEAGQ